MKRAEFLEVMAFLAAATQTTITADGAEAYLSLLGDLPADVFRAAAKRAVLSHPWKSFPSVAELREAAIETKRGSLSEMSSVEGWEIAWKTAARIDPDVDGSTERELSKINPNVAAAMRTYGIRALCYDRSPVAVIRSQFIKTFEQLSARQHLNALLPEGLKNEIRSIPAANQAILKIVDRIGVSDQ